MKHAFHSCYGWTSPRQVWVQLEKGKKWGLLSLPFIGNRSLAHSFSCSGERPGKGLGSWEHWDVIISMSSFARNSNSRKSAPPGPLGKVCKLFSVFLLDSRGKAGLKAASTSLLESAVLAEAEPSHINKERERKRVLWTQTKNSLFEIFFSPILSVPFSWSNLIRIYLVSQTYFF